MSFEPDQDEEFGAVCPYLGLADDADSHATYPTDAHRCYRLPNPTRIATHHQETYCLGANHTTCPVYVGNEVPGVPRSGGTPVPPPVTPPSGPAGGRGAAATTPRPRQGGTATMPRPRRTPGGTLGPRPRSGGVSMPVATIGLFALAIVVVAIAFGITQLTGNGNNNEFPATGQTSTPTATVSTNTVAGGGSATVPTASQTATAPATNTATGGGGGGGTYTVQDGDTCSGIAASQGVSLDALEAANGGPDGKCAALNAGDVLTIPS